MASARVSASLSPRDPTQWRSIIRAILRECTYLPDPIARTYMRDYLLRRYRHKAQSFVPTKKTQAQSASVARKWLSFLQRANEGYQKPLEKVLLQAYGRTGRRRREYLAQMLLEVPPNTNALRELVNQSRGFEDGWQPPMIVTCLIKSQMNNGIIQASRVRPVLRSLQPVIPEQNSWGKPVSKGRRKNIRRDWYLKALDCLLPPLPEKDLAILDGLISGDLPWAPPQRRKAKHIPVQDNDILLKVLTDGPQKGHTFRQYANGRPHEITTRFMRRQWRRISCLVPRMHWNATSSKWNFTWDSPKLTPQYVFKASPGLDLDGLPSLVEESRSTPSVQTREPLEAKDTVS